MAKMARINDIVEGYREEALARCRELLTEGQIVFKADNKHIPDVDLITFLGRAETLCLQGRKYLNANGLARQLTAKN